MKHMALLPQNILNIVSEASVLAVLAIAETFIITMGSIDLSVGSVVTVTGVSAAVLMEHHGATGLLIVPVVGLVAGAINGALFAWVKLPSFLVTLGTLYAFQGVALFVSSGSSTPLVTFAVSVMLPAVLGITWITTEAVPPMANVPRGQEMVAVPLHEP